MHARRILMITTTAAMMAAGSASRAETISFCGYTWVVRPSGKGGPGPNYWDHANVSVDTNGYLHLRLTHRNDRWYCSEVYTQNRLGFGRYQFWVIGRIDRMDQNVVLGLFNYPTSDVGSDGTHEIDIEFARWGDSSAPSGNYTVWPATNSVRRQTKRFSFILNDDSSTHTFVWNPTKVFFQSQHGHDDGENHQFASWLYQPANPAACISQRAMPVHLNLWCFNGQPPSNIQEVEVIVRAFKFTPM
jgi:hypothetical protein